MAKIEGLTIIINGDATPFKRAMAQARAEGTMLRRHLESINKLIKFDPGSTVLLTRRQQLLGSALAQNASHMAKLQNMNAQFAARAGELTDAERRQWMQVQRRMTEVELEYAKLRQQAIQYGAAASEANIAAQARFRGFQSTLSTVSNQLLAMSAVTGIIGAASVYAAAEFEQSFAGVRKTIIATQAEYDELAAATRRIALEKPISVNDVNEIMMYAGQLGIATENLTAFASTMADLDVATDMNLEDGSMQLARFMNIIGMSQSDVDRLGATIVDLGNNSATTESQIMLMAMRIAGSGANIGLSAQNVLALATSLSSVGIQAEMGGNAISTIMNRIDKAVALDQKTLSTWASTAGMTTEEFKYNWQNNVSDTLISVIKGLGTFREEGGNLNVLLKDMGISYMRQIDTMQRLSRAGQLTEDMFIRANTAWANNTALVREATQRYDTAESKLTMMKNALYDAGITIGQEILPEFKDGVLAVTGFVQAFGSMDDGTKAAVVNIGAVVTATGLLVKGLELGAGAAGGVVEKFAQLKTWLALSSEGATRYSRQSIALATSLGAEAVAAQANAVATRDQALAKAAAATAYANHLRSAGMDAAATAVDSIAAQQNAIAQAADAEATALNGAAKLRAAQSSSIFAVAQEWLSKSTMGVATALGITNGMLLAYAAAAVAAIAVVYGISRALDPMNRMTKATLEQKEQVDAAHERYQRLSSTLGEHADATVKAKAAYEDLNKEYMESAETMGQFNQRMHNVVKGLQEVKEQVDETTAETDSSAGRILNAMDGIERFKGATDEAGSTQLLGYISVLKDQVDGLDLTLSDARNETDEYKVAMQQAQEAARKVRFDAAYEAFGTMTAAAAEAETALAEFVGQYEMLSDPDFAAGLMSAFESGQLNPNSQQWQVAAMYMQLKDAADDANRSVEEQIRIMQDNADKSRNYETVMRYAADANVSMGDAVAYVNEHMGLAVTESEVMAYKEQQTAQAAKDASDAFESMREKLDGLYSSNAYFALFMEEAGASTLGLAQYLTDAGISVDDFSKQLEDLVQTASDAFNGIEVDAESSLYSVIETLQGNTEAMRTWGDDMNTLWETYGREGNQKYIDALNELASYGPEHANIVREILDGGQEAFDWYADNLAESRRQAVETDKEIIGAGGEQMVEATETAMDKQYSAVKAGSDKESAALSAAQEGMKLAVASAGAVMESTASSSFNAIGDSATAVTKNSGFMYGWGLDMMAQFKAGMIAAGVENYMNTVANTFKSLFHFSLPDEGPLRYQGGPRVWMSDMVDEMIYGMQSREGLLSMQANSLAAAIRSPIDGMEVGIGRADWGASASGAYGIPAPSTSTVINNYSVNGMTLQEGSDGAEAMKALYAATKVISRA